MNYIVTNFLLCPFAFQVSDPRETIVRTSAKCHLEVGGFVDEVGTHYARIKQESGLSIAAGGIGRLRSVIELPQDFYNMHQASFKLMTVGSESPFYWRFGVWVGSDGRPRLQAEKKGSPLRLLVQGQETLPLGRHSYRLDFLSSSEEGVGYTRFYVDVAKWMESRLPNMFGEHKITRAVWGFDGAADQDKYRMSLDIYRIGFSY